jgi:molybdate transport system ATP-binding protein
MSPFEFDCRFAYPAGFSLDVSFQAEAGVTALLGPSGAGKTTILLLTAGLLRPREGRIAVGETVLFDSRKGIDLPVHDRRIGLVFQDFQLFPHLTVEGNLQYGARRRPGSPLTLSHLIDVLELGPFLKRYPETLSGGQKQRVALGRAIASHPKLLLLDEPVSALDESLRQNILEYLKRVLLEYPLPTLLVTHDQRVIDGMSAATVSIAGGSRVGPHS